MKANEININIAKEDGKEKTVGKVQSLIKEIKTLTWKNVAKILTIFFGAAVIICVVFLGGFLYNLSKDDKGLDVIKENLRVSQENENIRDYNVTPKIQKELSHLVYTINADRAFLFELHNGKKNASGLPFRYADMTYEEVNDDKKIDKVAMNFQNIPLTLYKYPHYLQEKKVLLGTIDEIDKVDHDFAEHIKNCGGKYLGMIYLTDSGNPLGFLCVSFHDSIGNPSEKILRDKLDEYANKFSTLLDLDAQRSRLYDKKNDDDDE